MGQGACGGYMKRDFSLIKSTSSSSNSQDANNNASEMSQAKKIAELEEKLKQKDAEILGYQEAIKSMPEFNNLQGDACFRVPKRKNTSVVLIQSFKPTTVSDTRRQIEDYCRDLIINNDHISQMEQRMRAAIDKGLNKDTHQFAAVKCFPTYVRDLPTGTEYGKFLALDLGGTNFRVVLIDIGPNEKFEMDSQVYAISKETMEGSGEGLMDHIAECLATFAKDRGIDKEILPLGFTFSFPCRQKGLAVGELITWTKGFKCSGVEGQDVVALLKKAIDKRDDIKVDVAAILNDTTGCLMSCAWKNPKCRIGLIIGTGTNACYLEEMDNIDLVGNGEKGEQNKHMVVNTEWGAFGNQGELDFILTKWDREVDRLSINPGKQIFEKMISGMYMGEVVRQVLADLTHEGLIFVGQNTENLDTHGRFYTKYVSEIESDSVGDYTRCRESLKDLGMTEVSDVDCSALRYVCECVSRRAGFMVSAGLTALLKKMDYKDVVVAIDGSVFRFHPHFPNIMKSRISQLMGIDFKFELMLSLDGSGRGAAIVAAVLEGNNNNTITLN